MERADFVAVPVQDLKRAEEFYGTTLGLPRNPNSGPRWVEYELGNVTLALVSPDALGLDLEFAHGTIDSGVCHLATFHDPDGNALQLHRRYAPVANGSQP